MFDDQLLEAFIRGFYGYGNYLAPLWFIGMEEGGGNSHPEVIERLAAWDRRGRKELENVAEYHRAIGMSFLFDDRPPLQKTWKQLIRIALTAHGQTCDAETMREFQKSRLGTENGETCLLELLPLPSPSIAVWLYGEHSALPYLINRETYQRHVANLRIARLQERIVHYQPQAVVFYGLKYLAGWEQIAGVEFREKSEGVAVSSNGRTLFIAARHPVAMGVTNEYFQWIGKIIAGQTKPD